jgi:hypothetical protein
VRWGDEKYVRVYTRDTLDWQALSFEAQGLMTLILRKVDRAGLAKLGKHGKRGVAMLVCHPTRWSAIEPALEELLADGCVRIEGDTLVVPNYIEAQEAPQTDAQRKRAQRERDRDLAAAGVTKTGIESRNVTECHEAPTDGHEQSQGVTSGHSDPIRSVPSDPDPPSRASARVADDVPTVPLSEPGKPSARLVLSQLGAIRAEVIGGSALFWQPGPKTVEKAARWLADMPTDAVGDIQPAMRLACAKVRDSADGWTGTKMADPDVLVGALISKWGSLREELYGCAPTVRAPPIQRPRARGGIPENFTPDP